MPVPPSVVPFMKTSLLMGKSNVFTELDIWVTAVSNCTPKLRTALKEGFLLKQNPS